MPTPIRAREVARRAAKSHKKRRYGPGSSRTTAFSDLWFDGTRWRRRT